ncbi:MAG: hypothetical protein AB7S95_08760, partial [Mycolicibacterium sp.]
LSQASVVGINRGSDIRSTIQDHRNDRTYQQTVTGHVYYLDIRWPTTRKERHPHQKGAPLFTGDP